MTITITFEKVFSKYLTVFEVFENNSFKNFLLHIQYKCELQKNIHKVGNISAKQVASYAHLVAS